MVALKNKLQELKKQQDYGQRENPVPIIVVSDHISNHPDCAVTYLILLKSNWLLVFIYQATVQPLQI